MKHTTYFLAILTMVVCISCGDGSSKGEGDCSIPPPQAIFKKGVEGISNHRFKLSGRNSEESMVFADSAMVSIFQSGCDKIAQEFVFTLPTSPTKISRSVLAVDRLAYMARLGPDYMTFGSWAQAIDGLQKEFAQNNTVEVEPGLFIGLDKIDSSEKTTLIIKLFQK